LRLIVRRTNSLKGSIEVPPSKSHTHRAILLASLASGTSLISNPLLCEDCIATIEACRSIGAKIKEGKTLEIEGVGGNPNPPEIIDVKNSGTTIRFMTAVSSLSSNPVILTGDESIQRRPMAPLLNSLKELGAEAYSLKNNGCPPIRVKGRLKGGRAILKGVSSQFLSSLLIACPLADSDTELKVTDLKSRPYVEMTLSHLKRTGIKVQNTKDTFKIPGKQRIKATNYKVPGDYSSAAFFLGAAFITHSSIHLKGLDPKDVQGDKAIFTIIEEMKKGSYREIDLSNTPDLLPIVSVLACYAKGRTIIKNVEHARLKESDRITCMCSELRKMGASIKERKDGLVIEKSELKGEELDGHKDHRVVMALAVAGLGAEGTTVIKDSETISVSFPDFVRKMQMLNANLEEE
jgi:3-phosphoshikimate 1-carboxyvinyltransferase